MGHADQGYYQRHLVTVYVIGRKTHDAHNFPIITHQHQLKSADHVIVGAAKRQEGRWAKQTYMHDEGEKRSEG
jgi:hypothetical protein